LRKSWHRLQQRWPDGWMIWQHDDARACPRSRQFLVLTCRMVL
jgi:hypothetical protein